jgi:hypothetical protein
MTAFVQHSPLALAEDCHRCATVARMNRCRRSSYDPLKAIPEPTWLVVRDKCTRVLEAQSLASRADLRAVLTAAREARIAAGWKADPIGRASSSFFCAKDGTRVMVGIERRDPSKAPLNHGAPRK